MMSAHPLLTPVLWLLWLGALALIVGLPGFLLVGRHLSLGCLSRLVISLGAGLALSLVVGMVAGWVGMPLNPWFYAVGAMLVGYLSGRIPRWRETWQMEALPDPGARWQGVGGLAVLVALVTLVAGYGTMVAPPHIHDASNHAFLVRSVAQTGLTDVGSVFAGNLGAPERGYLPTWHIPAALVARMSGVAPYLSAWFFPIFLAALLPAALPLAWRIWGGSARACAVAALLYTGGTLVPGGVLEWGGFGQIVGLFLLPVLLFFLRAMALRPSVPTTALVILVWAGLARVHASEAVVAIVLAPLVWSRRGDEERASSGTTGVRYAGLVLVGVLAAALLAGIDVWGLAREYGGMISTKTLPPAERLGYSLEKFWKAAGTAPIIMVVTTVGLLRGLWLRRWRTLAVAAFLIGAMFVGLASLHDPVTAVLGIPFYRQAPRVLYLAVLFLPLLAAVPLVDLWDRLAARFGAGWVRPALALVLLGLLVPPWLGVTKNFGNQVKTVSFTQDDYEVAMAARGILPEGALVANFWDDGSTWAMHVARADFVQPMSWPMLTPDGGNLRDLMVALARDPGSEEALKLREAGVDYLWAAARFWEGKGEAIPTVENFRGREGFEAVAGGEGATLYRIHWENN